MDLKMLKDIAPWEWPEGADKLFLNTLRDPKAALSDRLLAAEMAGDYTVINDELAQALLSIVSDPHQLGNLRGLAPYCETSRVKENRKVPAPRGH